jgi:hypothetical protein
MYETFISKYCRIPTKFGPEIVPATEEEVIEHFTKYIEEKSVEPITLIQYYMPEEFKPRISEENFWNYICYFLTFKMEFESYDPGLGRMDEVWNYTYEDEDFEFKFYYMVYEKSYNEELFQQFACNDLTKITKVVFRIYNPDV